MLDPGLGDQTVSDVDPQSCATYIHYGDNIHRHTLYGQTVSQLFSFSKIKAI